MQTTLGYFKDISRGVVIRSIGSVVLFSAFVLTTMYEASATPYTLSKQGMKTLLSLKSLNSNQIDGVLKLTYEQIADIANLTSERADLIASIPYSRMAAIRELTDKEFDVLVNLPDEQFREISTLTKEEIVAARDMTDLQFSGLKQAVSRDDWLAIADLSEGDVKALKVLDWVCTSC